MDYTLLIEAVLTRIKDEMKRLHWNKYQTTIDTPFCNTGEHYKDNMFEVWAYYWGDDEDLAQRPNFKYGDFECTWYKHYMRNLHWTFKGQSDVDISASFLEQMLQDCFASMSAHFMEGEL